MRFQSELTYGGKVLPGREQKEGEHEGIVEWIDTQGIKAGERSKGTSRRNPKEASVIADQVLRRLRNPGKLRAIQPEDIAIIAAYGSQVITIRNELRRRLWKDPELFKRLSERVNTVDAFQGSESAVVFGSLTRSNEEGETGFLKEEKRLNVAVTRAQEELYIVGDIGTLVDRNDQPKSKEFFTRMSELAGKYGKITQESRQLRSRHQRRKNRHLHPTAMIDSTQNESLPATEDPHADDWNDTAIFDD